MSFCQGNLIKKKLLWSTPSWREKRKSEFLKELSWDGHNFLAPLSALFLFFYDEHYEMTEEYS